MTSLQQASIVHFLSVGIRNAAWLLCGYWLVAVVVELLSAHWPLPITLRVLEHFPEKVLKILRLLAPLKEAFLEGEVSVVQVRLVYGAAVLIGILTLSVTVSLCLWLLQRILLFWASKY